MFAALLASLISDKLNGHTCIQTCMWYMSVILNYNNLVCISLAGSFGEEVNWIGAVLQNYFWYSVSQMLFFLESWWMQPLYEQSSALTGWPWALSGWELWVLGVLAKLAAWPQCSGIFTTSWCTCWQLLHPHYKVSVVHTSWKSYFLLLQFPLLLKKNNKELIDYQNSHWLFPANQLII